MKNICMQFHILPWEVKAFKRSIQRFNDNYTPRIDINIHLNIVLNLSNFHTDWQLNKVTQEDILLEIYSFVKTLKFNRSYVTVLTTEEPNGHIDTWKHIFSNHYDGYIWYCLDTYYHKDYIDILLNKITDTNNKLIWISPTPDTERYKTLSKEDIDKGNFDIVRAYPGDYCMGFGWFDYASTSLINLVGWPNFECYGPMDSFIGFVMTGLYRALPQLDYGHYYLRGNVIKPDCVEEEDVIYRQNFTIKQDKQKQRTLAETNFFEQINERATAIYKRLTNQ